MMRDLGKKPVLVRKDIPGFLANRLQAAIMREALHLVENGYASIEDIDTVSRYSFGFRLAAAGPLLQKDISGPPLGRRLARDHVSVALQCDGAEPHPPRPRRRREIRRADARGLLQMDRRDGGGWNLPATTAPSRRRSAILRGRG